MNPDGEANMDIFTASERSTIQDIGEKLGSLKTSEIVNVSHNEFAWTQNIDEHGRISYDYGFVLETVK